MCNNFFYYLCYMTWYKKQPIKKETIGNTLVPKPRMGRSKKCRWVCEQEIEQSGLAAQGKYEPKKEQKAVPSFKNKTYE